MGACFSSGDGRSAAGGLSSASAAERAEAEDAVGLMSRDKGLSSTVELSISASKLLDKDVLSKSDPLCVVSLKSPTGAWRELGRTEVVANNISPVWVTQLRVVYNFEQLQHLKFVVYDVDTSFKGTPSKNLDLGRQQILGEVECLLSEIITSRAQTFARPLTAGSVVGLQGRQLGTLTVRAEEATMANANVLLVFRARNLDNKDIVGKSDPFLRISRLREDESLAGVYKTEVVSNNLNPEWKPINITLQQLCNGDLDRPVVIECLDYDRSGKHEVIGKVQLSLRDLQGRVASGTSMELMTLPQPNKPQRIAGQLLCPACTITPRPSFLDYVMGGCEISFLVAVDFTASNGDPSHPSSLHYMDPSGRLNSYQQAILSIGEVVQFYDSDKHFPVWGFGGKIGNEPVSHCFALNGNPANPEVHGVQGIMAAYATALQNVALAGPTLFAPVIHTAASIASQYTIQTQQKYFVLLIITDGVITDMEQTVAAVVQASGLPLSILIVGVGDADFSRMETLDADKKRLTANGVAAERDIVQFVPLRQLQPPDVAKEMLAELPGQLLSFMNTRGVVPNRPPSAAVTQTPSAPPAPPSAPPAPTNGAFY